MASKTSKTSKPRGEGYAGDINNLVGDLGPTSSLEEHQRVLNNLITFLSLRIADEYGIAKARSHPRGGPDGATPEPPPGTGPYLTPNSHPGGGPYASTAYLAAYSLSKSKGDPAK